MKRSREAPSAKLTSDPTVLSTAVIQTRLLSGLGSKGGARGSLTRCAARIGERLQSDPDQWTSTTTDAVARELQHLQLDMVKLALMVQRNQQEIQELKNTRIRQREEHASLEQSVRNKRQELQQQLELTACEREYEALAKLAISKHPVARRILQEQMDVVRDESRRLQEELRQATMANDIRMGQFQMLMQSLYDLKHSLTETLEVNENTAEDQKVTSSKGDGNGKPEPMDVEVTAVNKARDDEDLYDDLY